MMRHGDKLAVRRNPWQCMLIHDCDRVAASLPPRPASFSPLDELPMKPLIIGIAGGTGSGKSTVARNVAQALSTSSVAFLDMDAYYRNFAHVPLEERRQINWDHPEAFDWELLLTQLTALLAGESIDKPIYDFVSHTRSPQIATVPAAEVIVIDGILLFVDARVRELCDVKVFVDADADIRLIRRIRRDVAKRG